MLVESRKLSSSSRLSRLKSFPIEFKLQLALVDAENLPAKLSPELLPMEPVASETAEAATKSVLYFPKPGTFAINSYYRSVQASANSADSNVFKQPSLHPPKIVECVRQGGQREKHCCQSGTAKCATAAT